LFRSLCCFVALRPDRRLHYDLTTATRGEQTASSHDKAQHESSHQASPKCPGLSVICGNLSRGPAFHQERTTQSGTTVDCRINMRSEEHTSELQSRENLVCRL